MTDTRAFFALLAASLAMFVGCTNDNIAGKPAGSETSDEVAARILDTAGLPLPNALVRIRPYWYTIDSAGIPNHDDPSRIIDTRTDSAGRVAVKLPKGTYRIEVRAPLQGLVIPLELRGPGKNLHDQRTRPLASVMGRTWLPKGFGRAWIRVFGQECASPTDDSGNFYIAAVASGDSGMLLSATASGFPTELGTGKVWVVPRILNNAGILRLLFANQEIYSTWKHVVEHSPLLSAVAKASRVALGPVPALVRLDSSNFDFTSAAGDGRDLRFALPDGTHLPYLPRYYDSARGEAQIEVQLPSMVPGDTTPTILVLSGRDGVPSRSDSAGVWNGVADSLRIAATTFLVDDFNPASSRAKLPLDIPIGPWYLGMVDKATLVQPAGVSGNILSAIKPADSGRPGNAFDLEYTSTDMSGASYVVLGTNLDASPRSFRALDSVVFWARGNSQFWFAMEDGLAVSRKAWAKYSASASWTRYCVRPSNFLAASTGGNVGWTAARTSIRRLSFIVYGGSSLWVTDIRVYGMGVDEMR